MKKYITTDKQSILRKGIEIEFASGLYYAITDKGDVSFKPFEVDNMLDDGEIKELQQLEFTKDDMIDFARFAKDRKEMNQNYLTWDSEFNEWLKQRNEQI